MVESKRIPECGTNTSPIAETGGMRSVAECKPHVGLSLTGLIRGLAVGDVVRFPIEKHGTVKAVVSRIKTEQMRVGWNATIRIDCDNFQVVVKRVR